MELESTPEPGTERRTRSGSRALAVRTPRTVRSLRQTIPPSPAVVADVIEEGTSALIATAKAAVERTEIGQAATGVRDRLSNVISVNATSLALEAVLLLVAIIPRTYEVEGYLLPDLFVVLTPAFWSPFLAWVATSVAIPVVNALVFNLVSTTVAVVDTSSTRRTPSRSP